MSGIGGAWFNPFGDDANWDNGAPQAATGAPDSPAGLFGGQFASQQADSSANGGMDWAIPSAGADISGDGTGLQRAISPAVPDSPSAGALLDDVARQPPFNISDQALAGIRSHAENQVRMDSAERELLGPLAGFILPGLGASELAEGIVSGMIDVYNNKSALQDEQTIRDASDRAVFNALNDSENQQIHGKSVFPVGQRRVP